jgi:hypothetical protein
MRIPPENMWVGHFVGFWVLLLLLVLLLETTA